MAQLCEDIVRNYKINVMTSLAFNTSANSANQILSMPSLSSFGKKINNNKTFISLTSAPKYWYRKATAKRFSIDWDLNMNELEFE